MCGGRWDCGGKDGTVYRDEAVACGEQDGCMCGWCGFVCIETNVVW